MTILLDVSHWNAFDNPQRLKVAGVKGLYIKVSQGSGYRDPQAAEHYAMGRALGLKLGPYHFVTNDNALAQFDNYAQAAESLGKWDLPPDLDCEAYTGYQGEVYSLAEMKLHVLPESEGYRYEYFQAMAVGEEDRILVVLVGASGQPAQDVVTPLTISYPSQDIVDVIGLRLLKYHPHVAIYTNVGSGNRIFTKPVFGERYLLHVANWGVETPYLPNVWKGKPWMLWQKAVVDGAPYGAATKVDLNEWGTAIPFPGGDDEPDPTPVSETLIKIPGYKWAKLERE